MSDIGTVKILSDAECKEIVRKSLRLPIDCEIHLKSFCITKASSDLVGFMGDYYKLDIVLNEKNLEDKAAKKLCYFVKTVPLTNLSHRAECERKGFFNKETRIYSEILPNIQKYTSTKLCPECYYVRHDLIVLEDLSDPEGGFRHTSANEAYTKQHCFVVLRHLAKLHAASIAWELDEKLNIGERFKDVLIELHLSMNNEWYETSMKGIIFLAKMNDKFKDPKVKQFIDEKLFKILASAELYTLPSKKLRNVLCHRDSWDKNIFFKYNKKGEPVACQIVDFQLTRYHPPAIDILFFLYLAVGQEQRAQILDECLDYYYQSLVEAFKEVHLPMDYISRTEFAEDCKRARVAGLIIWAITEPLVKMPEGLSNKWRAEEEERFDGYMNRDRSEMFLRVIEIEAGYKEAIMRPIEELIEYLMANEDLLELDQ